MMEATHKFVNDKGHVYYGRVVGESFGGLVWFLPLCDDGKTWMKEPVCTAGVRPIISDEEEE